MFEIQKLTKDSSASEIAQAYFKLYRHALEIGKPYTNEYYCQKLKGKKGKDWDHESGGLLNFDYVLYDPFMVKDDKSILIGIRPTRMNGDIPDYTIDIANDEWEPGTIQIHKRTYGHDIQNDLFITPSGKIFQDCIEMGNSVPSACAQSGGKLEWSVPKGQRVNNFSEITEPTDRLIEVYVSIIEYIP